jgi:thymidylate synthase (FAD)
MDGWNEVSRRYVQDEPEFYFPEQWRLAPSDMKQGSAGFIVGSVNSMLNSELNDRIIQGWQSYKYAIGKGVAPEMARGFLPSNFQYTTWRWTTSLEAAIHFLSLRLDSHAQYEIQCYASAVRELLRDKFPESLSAFETGSEEKALEL